MARSPRRLNMEPEKWQLEDYWLLRVIQWIWLFLGVQMKLRGKSLSDHHSVPHFFDTNHPPVHQPFTNHSPARHFTLLPACWGLGIGSHSHCQRRRWWAHSPWPGPPVQSRTMMACKVSSLFFLKIWAANIGSFQWNQSPHDIYVKSHRGYRYIIICMHIYIYIIIIIYIA